MLRSSESETEILLGNKQLLGIFFLVAALIGVAFGGGFMLGRGAGDKKVASPSPAAKEPNPAGGETRTVSPPDTLAPDAGTPGDHQANQPALGEPKHKGEAKAESTPADTGTVSGAAANFLPQTGQEFLQVAAVPRNEAENVADVLRK